jgi:hypothetical protein
MTYGDLVTNWFKKWWLMEVCLWCEREKERRTEREIGSYFLLSDAEVCFDHICLIFLIYEDGEHPVIFRVVESMP